MTILNTEPDGWYEVMLINYHVDEEVKNVDLANPTITTTKTLLTDTSSATRTTTHAHGSSTETSSPITSGF